MQDCMSEMFRRERTHHELIRNFLLVYSSTNRRNTRTKTSSMLATSIEYSNNGLFEKESVHFLVDRFLSLTSKDR